ncbi:response regulator transcription factor [Stenotrophomonas sp. 24(2023)]|uniref:response regulator transcription factor n=1 Tax=Stenotrophomonas sp. 24(2023) TaxID=3068324 RepID=UPI0027DFB4B0|nr:response regulator transcription factor [Stenotrophomonas sp. 24(2023)]WMJ69174.1 response regulator transcription factor [Stenotrophomonas sp. 24(2023)]
MSHRICVALLDDHEIVRRGTAHHLAFDRRFRVVGSHGSADALLEGLHQKGTDVAVVDYALSPDEPSGDSVIERLQQAFPQLGLVVFSARAPQAAINRLLDTGVGGFVSKAAPLQELSDAILRVSQGQRHVPPACRLAADRGTLSRNEREVLRAWLAGRTISEIAIERHRSLKTVSTQKVSALRKLGLRNDVELYAMRHQLEAL